MAEAVGALGSFASVNKDFPYDSKVTLFLSDHAVHAIEQALKCEFTD